MVIESICAIRRTAPGFGFRAAFSRSNPLTNFAIQPACPCQKTQKLPPRVPYKSQHLAGRQRLGALPGIGFNPPAQILAPPWRQPMAASRIPDKTERRQQEFSFSWSIDGQEPRDSHQEGSEIVSAKLFPVPCPLFPDPSSPASRRQLAEQAVRSRIQLRNHIFQSRLLRLRQRKLRGDRRYIGLHQVALRARQLCLVAGNSL